MALKSAKYSEIPKGEMPITKSEAVEFQVDLMETLCPQSRRVFLKYGCGITSTLVAANCMFLHTYYRNALYVGTYRKIVTVIPGILVPATLNLIFHKLFITNNILVQKWACGNCYEIRSAFYNITLGTIYPTFVAPIIAIANARRLKLDVPPVNSKKAVNLIVDKTKPILGRYKIFSLLQIVVGIVVAGMEQYEINEFNENINKYIKLYQERLESENVESPRVGRGSP